MPRQDSMAAGLMDSPALLNQLVAPTASVVASTTTRLFVQGNFIQAFRFCVLDSFANGSSEAEEKVSGRGKIWGRQVRCIRIVDERS